MSFKNSSSHALRAPEQAVTDPDKLKPEQVADAAVDFAARHISNELGCRVSPDDVVLGFVRRLSSEDADTPDMAWQPDMSHRGLEVRVMERASGRGS